MNTYTSPFPKDSNHFLDPELLRKLAVDFPARPAYMDSIICSHNERVYMNSIMDIFTHGRAKYSRPNGGLWTLSYDEGNYTYDISDNRLPLLSSKQIFNRSWIHETIWFLSGSTDIAYLKANNVSIWDSWVIPGTERWENAAEYRYAEMVNWVRLKAGQKVLENWFEHSHLHPSDVTPEQAMLAWWDAKEGFGMGPGPIPKVRLGGGSIGTGAYGANWRKWEDVRIVDGRWGDKDARLKAMYARGFNHEEAADTSTIVARFIDQIADVIHTLKTNPDSRRIIVSAWNAAKVDEAALPPCHTLFQFISYPSDRFSGKRELTVKLTQR